MEASVVMHLKISLMKLFRMAIALLEIPVSGWTCLRTLYIYVIREAERRVYNVPEQEIMR